MTFQALFQRYKALIFGSMAICGQFSGKIWSIYKVDSSAIPARIFSSF